MKNILITGGAGFIGSNLVLHFVQKYPSYHIYVLDSLTYAGNLKNLEQVQGAPNFHFLHDDIRDYPRLKSIFQEYDIDAILHTAAESHVDRSITEPFIFAQTNVLGTLSLLEAARTYWEASGKTQVGRFVHISTDEVYGALDMEGVPFTESHRYDPHSPYSASKASSDHFVRAYHDTYGLPTLISNCSNNYGPYQFPEKLIPLVINNIKNRKPIPIYGTGANIRDWLYVQDHVEAIDLILHKGKVGQTYNIGGHNEWTNIDIVHLVIQLMDERLGHPQGHSIPLITYVTDRKGHDLRYAINASKIANELGWTPSVTFEEGIRRTIDWYLGHTEWMESVTSGAYQDYYQQMYGDR